MSWKGQIELDDALKKLGSSKGISGSRIKAVAAVAVANAREYKRVVHDVEKFFWKASSKNRLAGLYAVDAIIRQSRSKQGSKDNFADRFGQHLRQTIQVAKKIPEDSMPSARKVINDWITRQFYTLEEIVAAGGDYFLENAAESPSHAQQNGQVIEGQSAAQLADLLSIIKKQKSPPSSTANSPPADEHNNGSRHESTPQLRNDHITPGITGGGRDSQHSEFPRRHDDRAHWKNDYYERPAGNSRYGEWHRDPRKAPPPPFPRHGENPQQKEYKQGGQPPQRSHWRSPESIPNGDPQLAPPDGNERAARSRWGPRKLQDGTSDGRPPAQPLYCASSSVNRDRDDIRSKAPEAHSYKTVLCRIFQSGGTCRHGDKCLYGHGEADLRTRNTNIPTELQNNAASRLAAPPSRGVKKELCHHFRLHKSCKWGDACRHAHSESELAPPGAPEICHKFTRGLCSRGRDCRYLHDQGSGTSLQDSRGPPHSRANQFNFPPPSGTEFTQHEGTSDYNPSRPSKGTVAKHSTAWIAPHHPRTDGYRENLPSQGWQGMSHARPGKRPPHSSWSGAAAPGSLPPSWGGGAPPVPSLSPWSGPPSSRPKNGPALASWTETSQEKKLDTRPSAREKRKVDEDEDEDEPTEQAFTLEYEDEDDDGPDEKRARL